MFNVLLEASSTDDRAQLLLVSSPHASSWLSVVPSQGLHLHLDPPVHQAAMKWWLDMDTPHGSQCALCSGNALALLDIMPSLGSMGVMLWQDTTPFWLKPATGPILVCRWKQAITSWLMADHSHTQPAVLDKLGYRQVSCLQYLCNHSA